MVLGVQWLESLGPILWDFTRRTITFVMDDHRVCWSATDAVPSARPSWQSMGMSCPTCCFASMSSSRNQLAFHHSTRTSIKFGSYPARHRWQYAHTGMRTGRRQNSSDNVGKCCNKAPSGRTLMFSMPVVLMKKADNSCRLCVDYRTLNAKMIRHKFPILVIEELLDELRGAKYFTELDLHSSYH
jgi:hypothetical protein